MTKFHFLLILTCMMCMFYISCEESKVQYDLLSESEIKYREIDDCEDCPIDYCCCTIELQENSPDANLSMCGVYTNENPTTPCGTFNPGSPCASFSGTVSPMPLDQINFPRRHFCLEPGGTFRIVNNNSSESVRLKMTCRASDTDPFYHLFQMDATDVLYFMENGDCDLIQCP